MNQDILAGMTKTVNKLLQAIDDFPEEKFNTVPFEGSWTPAQVSDHILKSVSGVLELLYATTKLTSRNPDEKVDAIKAMFLDFTIKMKSPDFVLPRNTPIEKETMLSAWEDLKIKILEATRTLDLSATCAAFELPVFEELTRSEWVWFAIYHMQRHTHQLKNIYEILINQKQLA
ncbi:MAG TPA: DinB family protein [Chitinophagaceae bacterium]|nr:DinB family protein [Chitinophagaceae bacterium]